MELRDESPPDWIEDDGQVGRRIVRRRHDVLTEEDLLVLDADLRARETAVVWADIWWELAEVVRHCRALTSCVAGTPIPDQLRRAAAAQVRVRGLAALLPPAPPPVRLWEPIGDQTTADLAAWGPRRDVVNTLASTMCDELDDPSWTCPLYLAGIVDDLRLALRAYASGLKRLLRHGCVSIGPSNSRRPLPVT